MYNSETIWVITEALKKKFLRHKSERCGKGELGRFEAWEGLVPHSWRKPLPNGWGQFLGTKTSFRQAASKHHGLSRDWDPARAWVNFSADSSPPTPMRIPVLRTPWFQAWEMLNRGPTQAYQTSDLYKLWGNRFVLFSSPNLVGSCSSRERQQIGLL